MMDRQFAEYILDMIVWVAVMFLLFAVVVIVEEIER